MRNRDISQSMNMSAEEINTNSIAVPSLGLAGVYPQIASNPAVKEPTMSESIGKIAMALSKAQGELEGASKSTEGYGYNYSDLSSVIKTAKPVLTKNELAIVQLVGNSGDKFKVTTILTHSSGEFFKSEVSSGLVDMKGVNDLQKAGATISYLRRYAYQAILGMSSEDNDASSNGFSKPNSAAPKKSTNKAKERFVRTAAKKETTGEDDDI